MSRQPFGTDNRPVLMVAPVVLAMLTVSGVAQPQTVSGTKGLFTESRSATQFRAQRNSQSLRSRHVKIDFDLLGDARGFRRASQKGRQSLELNLFPDTSFTALLDKIEPHPKGYSWIGQVQGTPESIVILTITDGVMSGNISVSDTAYQIRHTEAGVHAIRQVDPEATRPEAPPTLIEFELDAPAGRPAVAPDEGGKLDGSSDRIRFTPLDNVSLAVSPDAPTFAQAGSGDFFDLLVVYTPAAKSAAGGTAGIESLIQLGVTETNLAYQNSGIIPRIRLVHAEEVSYSEFDDLELDLYMAQNGFIPNVHSLRDTYGADLVQVVTDSNASFCGKAYLMAGNNPSFHWWSYSVVEQSCISSNYSFGHELAHSMGSDHAPGDVVGVAAYGYSKGYKDLNGEFRTLMALDTGCNCTRALRYSSQSLTHLGKPTGNSSQDNSLSINNVRFTVSGFREATSCAHSISTSSQSVLHTGASGSLTVSTTSGCSWTATSSESWITITGGSSGSGNGSGSYTVSSNTSTQLRSGTITVEGQLITITQDGSPCSYSLSPFSASFDSSGGSGSASMAAPTGCAWTATSSQSWISISEGSSNLEKTREAKKHQTRKKRKKNGGSSGSANGTVSYSVASNSTSQSRSGAVTAEGQILAITQSGIPSADGGNGVSGATTEIPTLSEWGFIIMGICLLCLGAWARRRRSLSDFR